jgi:hypothetical protein
MPKEKIDLLICCVLLSVTNVTSAVEKCGFNKKQAIGGQQKVISTQKSWIHFV